MENPIFNGKIMKNRWFPFFFPETNPLRIDILITLAVYLIRQAVLLYLTHCWYHHSQMAGYGFQWCHSRAFEVGHNDPLLM